MAAAALLTNLRRNRSRRLPPARLPARVATSIKPRRADRRRPLVTATPPRPASREERELASLLREILPEEPGSEMVGADQSRS